MEFKSVAILLTEDCNAHCKMCCDSRGLVKGKTLSLDEINLILSNIKSISSINSIGITGGEPMLYEHLVNYILNYDFGRSIKFSIKSNGFWGRNIEFAENFISKNSNKIDILSFSYDQFHKEFISADSIRTLLNISKKYNIKTEVVGCFVKGGLTPGLILDELGEEAYYTKFCYQPVISTGSGNCFNQEEYIKTMNSSIDDIRCLSTLDPILLINPDLDVYPCCSQVVENTILLIGNLRKNSLSDIKDDLIYNQIFHTLFTKGFSPFINLLDDLKISYPDKLSSPCEFCEFLFSNDWFLKKLVDVDYYEDL